MHSKHRNEIRRCLAAIDTERIRTRALITKIEDILEKDELIYKTKNHNSPRDEKGKFLKRNVNP